MHLSKNTQEELEEIYNNRSGSKKSEWDDLKKSYIDSGLETLLSEDVDSFTFHIVYNKITTVPDCDVFEDLLSNL